MKLSIAEFTDAIGTMNTCLETKQKNLELLEKAINSFINEEALQGKSYQSAKNYFRDMHLPVVRGMILAYEEIKRANTSCLNDLHTQVSSDYSMKIDTEGLAYYLNEAKNTLSQLEELEQNSSFAQGQRANIQTMENQINKVACFNMMHVSHYDTSKTYMNQVGTALAQFKHKSYDTKTKTYKYTVKDKVTSNKINQNWKAYQYNKMLKDCMKEDGRIDYKKLNSNFWNRTDGYFAGNWWQDPEKLATATYVLKLEAKAYGEINIVDMISQYKDGEHNPRLNTLQALANDQRISSYDVSLIDAITTNLYASGINFDESKGTLTAKDLEVLQKREKNIIFRKVGNWLENGGLMLVEGVVITAMGAVAMRSGSGTAEYFEETTFEKSKKYKIGESPKIKSATFSKAGVDIEKKSFEYYKNLVEDLNVSTKKNQATFYSGPGNRELAEAFAKENSKITLETTTGGKYLDDLKLFENGSTLTGEQAAQIWSRLSERYAQGASGNAYGFVNGSRPGSIFNTVEYPALKNNPNITNVYTEFLK